MNNLLHGKSQKGGAHDESPVLGANTHTYTHIPQQKLGISLQCSNVFSILCTLNVDTKSHPTCHFQANQHKLPKIDA